MAAPATAAGDCSVDHPQWLDTLATTYFCFLFLPSKEEKKMKEKTQYCYLVKVSKFKKVFSIPLKKAQTLCVFFTHVFGC